MLQYAPQAYSDDEGFYIKLFALQQGLAASLGLRVAPRCAMNDNNNAKQTL